MIFRQYADASSTSCRLACLLLNCNQQPGASPTYIDISYHSSLANVILQQYCCLFERDIFRPCRCLVTTILTSVSFATAARVGSREHIMTITDRTTWYCYVYYNIIISTRYSNATKNNRDIMWKTGKWARRVMTAQGYVILAPDLQRYDHGFCNRFPVSTQP